MNQWILLVEDDAVIRNNVCSLLQQEGYRTTACASLEEARTAFRKSRPDLVVLDVLLPRIMALLRRTVITAVSLVIVCLFLPARNVLQNNPTEITHFR